MSLPEFTAIETFYGGYRFRSRTEARWAVFFDQAGIEFEYEPEGFSNSTGSAYLPDFYLPHLGCYAEVKPPSLCTLEIKKVFDFAITSQKSVIVFVGIPSEHIVAALINARRSKPFDVFMQEHKQAIREAREEGYPISDADSQLAMDCLVENAREVYFAECLITGKPILVPSNSASIRRRLVSAALFAKQSRFEFGQTPARPHGLD